MSERILSASHRLVLRLLPARFRTRYAADIQRLYEEHLRDVARRGGSWRAFVFGLAGLVDAIRGTYAERMIAKLRRRGPAAPIQSSRSKEPVKMETILQDVRFGLRTLAKRPGWTAAAILILALGIGLNASIFSIFNALLLKPVFVDQPDRLLGCYNQNTSKPDSYRPFSYPDYRDLAEVTTAFSNIVAHNLALVGLLEGDSTRRVFADIVSSNFFETLGVPLQQGRSFLPEEEEPGSSRRSAIVSHSLWRHRGSDPRILGQILTINGQGYTVVGVLPPKFTGLSGIIAPDIWLPMGVYQDVVNLFGGTARTQLQDRSTHELLLVGRLKEGASRREADADLAGLAARLASAFPAINGDYTVVAQSLPRIAFSTSPGHDAPVQATALLLLSMTLVVLLIACFNLANMQAARSSTRRREFSVRVALGVGRRRLIRQLLTEAALLAFAGAIGGLLLASFAPQLLIESITRLMPIRLAMDMGWDWRVVAATFGCCVFSLVVFALVPALKATRSNPAEGLRDRGSEGVGGTRIPLRRQLPVMVEISLALMLLIVTGLFVRASVEASRAEVGFDPSGGLVANVDVSLLGYDRTRSGSTYQRLLDRVRAMPGIRSASLASLVPFGDIVLSRRIQRAEDPADAENVTRPTPRFTLVGADYFATLGLPVLRGRTFTLAEERSAQAAPKVIVDQELADRLWPGEDALGRQIRYASGETDSEDEMGPIEVVGIVGDIQDDFLSADRSPHLYAPFRGAFQSQLVLHAKVAGGEDAAVQALPSVREAILETEPRMPILSLKTFRFHIEESLSLWLVRAGAKTFVLFGGLALFLAAVGVYGVRAHTVAARTREVGIRMALGCTARGALWLILREGLLLTAVGSAMGLALGAAAGQLVSSFLYGSGGLALSVLFTSTFVLGSVSMLACYLPARRAAGVDPVHALRCD